MPRRGSNRRDASGAQKSKRWCFTINFQGRETVEEEDYLPPIGPPVRYRIYQLETGDNNTPHFQGYFECSRDVSLRSIKRWEGFERAHLEPAGGDLESNQRYCSKEEGRQAGPFEEGNAEPQPGRRNDLNRLKDAIDEGCEDRDLFELHFSSAVRYIRGLQHYRHARVSARTEAPKVVVYWGEPGSGKSARAFKICAGRGWTHYPKNNTKWWDGYAGDHAVIFSEFDPSVVTFRYLLELLDRYPVKVEVKGAMVQFNSRVIFLCANAHPKDWYPNEDYAPLRRRIEKIVHFKLSVEQEVHVPHECENEEDSLDEGERVVIDGTEEHQAEDEDWDSEEEIEKLRAAGVLSPRASPDSPDELVMYDEIPEEIRSEIREGKKEIDSEKSSANVIDLTND